MNQLPTPSATRAGRAETGVAIDAARYSALLLRLYEIARKSDVETFQHQAMELTQEVLPFDGAWWGRASRDGGADKVHWSYLYRLPEDIPQILNTTDPENIVARRTRAAPDVAHWFGPEELEKRPSTAALTEHMGLRQVLCITHVEPLTGVATFVSLMRRDAEPAFSDQERRLLELLEPHLAAAMDMCCTTYMSRLHRADGSAILTTDSEGWIYVAEPAVAGLLEREWSGWSGPRLPSALIELISLKRSSFLGQRIRADNLWVGDYVLVTLHLRHARDALTPKECEVAEAFSSGHSYKEVARTLNLAPATVRHHLRAVYQKLGIADKAALARLLK